MNQPCNICLYWESFLRWGFLIWELIFFYCGVFVLILVVFFFVVVSFSQCFGQMSSLAFFRWLTTTSDRNAESCNRIPSNYCLSCCLSHHIFDQVNLWPAWVGIETAIFWQCSPVTMLTCNIYLKKEKCMIWRLLFFLSNKSFEKTSFQNE